MSRITQAKLGRAKFVNKILFINGEKRFRTSIKGYSAPEKRMQVEYPKRPGHFFLASIGQRINISKLRNKVIYSK